MATANRGDLIFYQYKAADVLFANQSVAGEQRLALVMEVGSTLRINVYPKPGDGFNVDTVSVTGVELGSDVGDGKWLPSWRKSICMRANGRNGAGAWAIGDIPEIGDRVEMVANDGDDVSAGFETVITVAGEIQQSSATDYTLVELDVTLSRLVSA